ncbi:MAG: hypothetical protein ABIJ59_18790 [Pseudomonadota bacterium]
MKQDSNSNVFHDTMLKGGLAAGAAGLVAIVAAFTAPPSILIQYTGMGIMGVAALGVILFYAAFLFAKGRWWAGLPSFCFAGVVAWVFIAQIARVSMLYFEHNPIKTFNDVLAPLPFISLQLILVCIAFSLGSIVFRAIKLSRSLSQQPVNKFVWGSMALWVVVLALDCMYQVQ